MAAIEKKISFRCDDTLDSQLDEILENEISKARRDNLSEPKLADVIRMAIKEKYARDVTGEEKDTYMEMMKNSFENSMVGLINSFRADIKWMLDKHQTDCDFHYKVISEYQNVLMLTSGFKADDEELFKKAIGIDCGFRELIEEHLIKNKKEIS